MTVYHLRLFQITAWLLFLLLASSVQAQLSFELPAGYPDTRTLKVQRKVDELFERGEFERAYFIYRNELAPIGDKYAQYMVGFMHLTGMGVEEDPVAASAWYRLAAERGTPQFVAVRDMLLGDMTDEQLGQSDQRFIELRRDYSDLVILLSLIKRGMRDVAPATGTRLKSTGSPMTVIDSRSPNQSQSSTVYYRRIQSELQGQLVLLAKLGNFKDMETDPDRVDIDEIERRVNERLELLGD